MPHNSHKSKSKSTSRKHKNCNWHLQDDERDFRLELHYYNAVET